MFRRSRVRLLCLPLLWFLLVGCKPPEQSRLDTWQILLLRHMWGARGA